jgi:DNA-binding beta-propeller fold protein YncE
MSFRNKGGMAATVLAILICVACGQIYRPVVIPINNIPPNPGDFHAVFSLNTNAVYGLDPGPTLLYGPGSAMQIDVGGDTDLGIATLVDGTVSGANPTHAISLPNFARVFVASAGSAVANGVDAISSFVPATQSATSSGIGATNVVSYPNFVANPIPNSPDLFCPYLPDFVAASQNVTVYVANYGVENAPSVCTPNGTTSTDSIAVVNASTNVITNIVYAAPGATPPVVLSHPVAMAQVPTPNGNKLYVLNQGNNTVSSFYTVDMTPTTATGTVAGFSGTTPAWVVARGDGQQVYVLTSGSVAPPVDSQLWTIDAATDTVIGNVSVGTAGANYVLYDPNLNRLYVTNPNIQVSGQNQIACPPATMPQPYFYNSTAFIFSVAGSLPSPLTSPIVLATNPCPYPSCANGCAASVAALPDGTRAYIASYELVTLQVPPPLPPLPPNPDCTDPSFTTPASPTSLPVCYMGATVTVLDALSMAITTQISALAAPAGDLGVVPEAANCLPANANGLYTPSLVPVSPEPPSGPVSRFAARFRVSAVAAADSTRVYVSVCDAGAVAIINTTDSNTNNPAGNIPADTLVLDLATPFGIGTPSNSLPQQNPIYLFSGQ